MARLRRAPQQPASVVRADQYAGRVRVLMVANRGDDDPGYVGAALEARGAEIVVAHREDPEHLPDPLGFDVVVSLGSDWSVYWPRVADQVAAEAALLRAAADAQVPVLGICFGGQVLAHALGGTVERAPEPEVGWFDVDSDLPDLIPVGPYLQWHWDRFVPPPGSTELARSAAGSQAYVSGSALGLQFHPEATAQMLRRWSEGVTGTLDGTDVRPADVVAEADERGGDASARADHLVEMFLSGAITGRPALAGR
jgi:GMP synthase-like glutamine amidotransferase